MSNVLKVGDKVIYRPSFGMGDPTVVTVQSMEVTEMKRSKYGDSVNAVPWELVEQNRVLMTLDNDSWTYSEQVDVRASKQIK